MPSMKLRRYAGNPILKPRSEHPWEALNVFNAAVVHHGFHWSRLDKPVLSPATEFEARGVEDPRVSRIGDTFYMVYVGYSTHGTRVSLAASKNLIAWERLGVILPDEDNKDAALFPEKIGGRYCLLHRRPPDIWLCYSDDLLHWTGHQVVMQPHPNAWEHEKVGIAGPPTKTEQGWLLIYHAVDQNLVYRLGVALLDANNPSVVLHRGEDFFLEPREPWEKKGDVPNVVFSCGQVVNDETLYVYYGGADRVMAVATCSMSEIMGSVTGK
jgi:predicted GH43/DUF377 family glycosyl hydrolase